MLTQADIAKRIGVSQVAVSYALRGGGRLSAARRRAILEAMEQLGYRPNASARAIRSRRFGAAGILFRRDQSFFPLTLIHGVGEALAKHDMHLALAELPMESVEGPKAYAPKLLRELSVDGFLVHHALDVPDRTIEVIRKQRIPAIWINVKGEWDCVRPDDLEAGQRATELLLQAGHRRIAFVLFAEMEKRSHYSWGDRVRGYRQAMHAAGLADQLVHHPLAQLDHGSDKDQRPAVLRALLGGADRPTALVLPGPAEAFPALTVAASLGLRIPQELSVVVLRDRPMRETGQAITTLEHPMEQIGREAAEMLVQKIESPQEPLPAVVIRFLDPVGNSVARAC